MISGGSIFVVYGLAAVILCGDPLLFRETAADFKPSESDKPHVNKSSSRRFHIYGNDQILTQQLTLLSENIVSEIERSMNITLRCPAGTFRIYAYTDPGTDKSSCSALIEGRGGTPVFSVMIINIDKVDKVEVIRCVVRQIVNFSIYSRMKKEDVSRLNSRDKAIAYPDLAPGWVTEGILGNILAGYSSKHAMDVLGRWRDGRLPDIDVMLGVPVVGAARDAGATKVDQAVATLFIDWVNSWDRRGVMVEKVFSVYAGTNIVTTADITALNPSFRTWQDLLTGWDKYLLAKRRSVLSPGRLDAESVHNFRNQLVLYPGTSGIPAYIGRGRDVIMFSDLISLRNENWMRNFAQGKRITLYLVSAGRGDDMKALADSYGEFLNALTGKENDRKLRELLDAAEKDLARVTSLLHPSSDDSGR